MSPARPAEELLHELQVHQVELEMQNESLHQARHALEESHNRYVNLYDFAPIGYLTLTEQGLISEINLAAAKLLGVERGKLRQRPFAAFVAPEDTDRWHLHFARAQKQEEMQVGELTLQRSDGIPLYVQMSSQQVLTEGQVLTVRIGLTDITKLKLAEFKLLQVHELLHEKNVELEKARSLAEKASQAKSDFLSSMSHELRTPLNAILGFAQLMESASPPPNPSQKRSLDQILKGGWYLLELINEILDLAKIESGKITLSREAVSLSEIMLECRSMIEPQARKRDIALTFPRFETPCFIDTDRTRLKQVLINLLSNAIKYNKPNGAVSVAWTLNPVGSIRIGIRDTGTGLAPEQLAQLFQPFNRLGKETEVEEGTGIGLVVTKRLVDMMGGTIGVESAIGVGSEFWIELGLTSEPLPAVQETGHEVAVSVSAPMLPQISKKAAKKAPQQTLLYVEDDPVNRELVEHLIARRPDLRLISAADGNLGIELARIHQPAVILMDLNLPGINGIEAMKTLRTNPATAHILVIALSANEMPHSIETGLDAGFFGYLSKPIKVNEFMDTLDTALKHEKGESRPS